MKIVVLDGHTVNPGDNPWPTFAEGAECVVYPRTPLASLHERCAGAEILVTNKAVIDSGLLAKLPDLRFITVSATGYNVVDVQAAGRLGIPVANVPDYGTNTVAQYVFALLLQLCHRVGEHAEMVRRGEWVSSEDWCFWKNPQVELDGLCLGIVGYGRIGRRVAELARAFGMRVLYTSRSAHQHGEGEAERVSLEELFARADVVSLHCSLDEQNRRFVNRDLLRRMKPSALLINTARGGLIEEADLAEALKEGVLAGAALDVLSTEPPNAANPLLQAPRCWITPHMAWASLAARQRIVTATVANIQAFLAGSPINVVNAAALEARSRGETRLR